MYLALLLATLLIASSAPARAADLATAQPEDRVIGDRNAPGTIVEYASFTCPHCAHFHTDLLPQVKLALLDKGLAKLVFRDFPLDRLALAAAMLARCGDGERSMEAVGRLFDSHAEWARASKPVEAIVATLAPAGLTPEKADRCLSDESLARAVIREAKAGQDAFQIDGTPTFVVNGKKLENASSVGDFAAALGQ